MDDIFRTLSSVSQDEFYSSLDKFVTNPTTRLKFEELDKNDLRTAVWSKLFDYLKNPEHASIHEKCCTALRILSRDKTNLDSIITLEKFNVILQKANLNKAEETTENLHTNTIIEALKLICNLLYNSSKVQHTMIQKTSCLPSVLKRISKYDEHTPHDMKIYDLRILFLATVFNIFARCLIRKDMNGDVCLIDMLQNISSKKNITDEEAELVCEVLKVLFNLYMHMDNLTEDEIEKYTGLVGILRQILICKNEKKQQDLNSNVANLLTVIPSNCYSNIITPASENEECVYNKVDMRAVSKLLEFLDIRLNCPTDLVENISPIVTALLKLVKNERFVRKYIKLQILPPLKDVMNRPEEGTTIRAKLCKLLTIPLTALRDLVAEFLFVLCKENVDRMIKYTGYGNAAGMFANKGLLGKSQQKTNYSSDSENSDTEEYTKYKEQINPVTGCYEGPKSDPCAGMTDEQKEYEALKLVQHIDQLNRQGVLQPCRIGPDGKPVPIEHVLQLQEELQKQQIKQDSDSD